MRLVKHAAKMLGNGGDFLDVFLLPKMDATKKKTSFLHLSGCRNDIPGCTQIWDDFVAFIGIVVQGGPQKPVINGVK